MERSKEIVTAAMCTRCGRWSQHRVAFDIQRTDDNKNEVITEIQPSALRVFCKRCRSRMVNVDPLIVQPILDLNLHGYKTTASCQGHYREVVLHGNDDVTGKDTLITKNAILFPYVTFSDRMPWKLKRRLYLTANEILDQDPDLNLQCQLQKIRVDEHGNDVVIDVVPPRGMLFLYGMKEGLFVSIGSTEIERLARLDDIDPSDPRTGEEIARDATRQFWLFLKELANRLK